MPKREDEYYANQHPAYCTCKKCEQSRHRKAWRSGRLVVNSPRRKPSRLDPNSAEYQQLDSLLKDVADTGQDLPKVQKVATTHRNQPIEWIARIIIGSMIFTGIGALAVIILDERHILDASMIGAEVQEFITVTLPEWWQSISKF